MVPLIILAAHWNNFGAYTILIERQYMVRKVSEDI